MNREEIVDVLNLMQRGWDSRDPVILASVHSDDGVVHSPIFGTVHGRAGIEQSYRNLLAAFADLTYEPLDPIIDGARAAQVFTFKATHAGEMFGVAATHRRFKLHGVLVFEFRDGKITVERRFYDFAGFLMQIGAIKAKPGA